MKKVQNPLVEQKLYEGDLIARVLDNRFRAPLGQRPGHGGIGNPTTSLVIEKINGLSLSVILNRYTLLPMQTCVDTSIAGVAKELGLTVAKVIALEASAIKRLRESDCYWYFVENFGSREILLEQLVQIDGETESFAPKGNPHWIENVPEGDLARVLEYMRKSADIFKKHALVG